MNKSASINNLAKALSLAQAEMPVVKMDAKNPFLKNKYATLGAVIDTSRPILAKNGLSISQFPISQEGRIGVTSILMHSSGEWIEETITVVPDQAKGLSINQTSGVTISYLRRYAWSSILGLYADEDTDGDSNHAATVENNEANAKVAQVMRSWTDEQTTALSVTALDEGLEPINREDAEEILGFSVLPSDVSTTTIKSWFKHYLKTEGGAMQKAQAANEAYTKAKKGSK